MAAEKGHMECCKLLLNAGADVTATSIDGTALQIVFDHNHAELVEELTAAEIKKTIASRLPLIKSIRKGNLEFIEKMIQTGADVNYTDEEGNTPLIMAVDVGNEAVVKLLLEKGAEINRVNDEGKSALYTAVFNGHAEQLKQSAENSTYVKIVYILLMEGAIVQETYSGFNPSTAHLKPHKLETPNRNILEMLMAAGAELKHELCLSDESLQDLARKSIRKHLKQIHPDKNLYGTIPQLGLPRMMKSYLLYDTLHINKADLKKADVKELFTKVSQGDMESVHNLIQEGMDANVQDETGMTPLMGASQAGHIPLVEKLIKAGADVNIQTVLGNTALIHATMEGQNTVVQKLLEYGADANIRGKTGQTALMYALDMDNGGCLQTLVHSGANLNIQDDSGVTAAIKATRSSTSYQPLSTLIEAGADVNLASNDGFTPLIIAASDGNVNYVKKLIEAGADINSAEKEHKTTALMYAGQKGHIKCVKRTDPSRS